MYYEELTPGRRFPLPDVTVEREEMLEFARRYNRAAIHLDEAAGRASIYGDIIAPGAFSQALVHAVYIDAGITGNETLGGKSVLAEWRRPVYAGDTLSSEAEILSRESRRPDRGSVRIRITARNQKGDTVMYITTDTVVKKRPADL